MHVCGYEAGLKLFESKLCLWTSPIKVHGSPEHSLSAVTSLKTIPWKSAGKKNKTKKTQSHTQIDGLNAPLMLLANLVRAKINGGAVCANEQAVGGE